MTAGRALYHMVRADFLERVRRYSFLLTMAFSIYLGYAVYSGQVTLQLGEYHGVENSAWLGSVIGLVGSFFLSLVAFYIVKNSIQRDRQTRVGQILATTPISKGFYTIGKTLSNAAVLAVMVLVLGLAALAIQIVHRGDAHIDLLALEAPVLVFGLSSLALTAALAVLFESLPVLRGGVGNVLYFFLWITLIAFGASGVDQMTPNRELSPYKDYTGMLSVMSQMQNQVRALDPAYTGGAEFSVGGLHPATKTFLWMGLAWTPALLMSRGMLLALAAALALLAALFFDRFDPARASWFPQKKPKAAHGAAAQALLADKFAVGSLVESYRPPVSAAHLTPLARTEVRIRFFALVVAELKLLLRGHAWWWYAGAAGAILGCLFSPLEPARSGVIVFAWLWPMLIWSQLGSREALFSTGSLIFSAPHAVPRQLLATYAAGVMVAAITGGGLGIHLLLARDFAGLGAWATGALFIPALALALGVTTGSRKFFEALYTAWWYVGPLHHTPQADFMGTTPMSSTPGPYLAAAAGLFVIAYVWRRVKLGRA
jgi:hypothetical protein